MRRPVGMCPGMLLADGGRASEEQVRLAIEATAAAGFTELSVWAFQLPWMGDLSTHGLQVTVLEGAGKWANGAPDEARREADALAETAARLGTSLVLAYTTDPEVADFAVAQHNLGLLVSIFEQVHARVCIEFLPWSGVPDLATAWRLIEPLGPAATLVIDTWHWVRQPGGPDLDLLARIPGERLSFMQVSDAPATRPDNLLAETTTGRLLPGEGIVDFTGLLDTFDGIGADPFVATEIFNPDRVRRLGPHAWATAAREATEKVLRG